MLDFVVIFSKGGVVLWNYNPGNDNFTSCVNNLIRCVILEERSTDTKYFEYDNLAVQFKLDNEFELVLAVVFQKAIQLPYVDSFLSDLQKVFKNKFRDSLSSSQKFLVDYEFEKEFQVTLSAAEKSSKSNKGAKQMRTFNESLKSQKTVSSLIEDNTKKVYIEESPIINKQGQQTLSTEELVIANRKKLKEKLATKKSPQDNKKKINNEQEKVGKKPRVWELGGSAKDAIVLDRSKNQSDDVQYQKIQSDIVGTMQGEIRDLEVEEEEETYSTNESKNKSGLLSYLKGIVGSKVLTRADLQPALEKIRDHLISKNVASDIAAKLCDSVALNLEGKSLGTLETIASLVKNALTLSLLRILSPKRRIDIIRDAMESKKNKTPYTIIFCGVNGVGKSTNLAKICFWLIENGFNVLIAACDTFRAGAVEQLRTHTRHINALHPAEKHNRTMVQLYEKGYGKDAAGIAMEAIKFANDTNIDIVLVDTAGRMQDNEPLMRSLSKLIKMNNPDLVLFVGEALVGNEAVDQLVKFNQSLADYSSNENPHIIDGIVLTKFDTIDDKVGAAISMAYVTGQPIVFVGTGQTYSDLKALNVNAVVQSLMK